MGRISKNNTLNRRGKQLLALYVSSALRLLNGRTTDDILGTCTCHHPLGSSVVDCIAVSYLVHLFTYFNVHDFHPDLSDHCQISCLLNCNFSTMHLEKSIATPYFFSWQNCATQVLYYWQKFTKNSTGMLQIESLIH